MKPIITPSVLQDIYIAGPWLQPAPRGTKETKQPHPHHHSPVLSASPGPLDERVEPRIDRSDYIFFLQHALIGGLDLRLRTKPRQTPTNRCGRVRHQR